MRRAAGALLSLVAMVCISSMAIANDLVAQRAAAHQLVRGQLKNGLLDFDMDFLAGKGTGSGSSNVQKMAYIARQASAAYGLAKYYEQTKDEHVREPLAKLIQSLGELSLPIGKSPMQRVVESIGLHSLPIFRHKLRDLLKEHGLLFTASGNGALVAYEQGYATAWAGTTAMALLAELHYFRATGDSRFAALRERWREGLEVLHVSGKGFREYPDVLDEGAYANGEAWLAFAVYIDTLPSGPLSADEMRGLDSHMIATYSGADSLMFFHWGAMAASRRFWATKEPRLLDFAEGLVRGALASMPPADGPNNSCPTVEGLAASAATLRRGGRADTDLHRALTVRIRAEMDKNNALQLPPEQARLAPAEGVFLVSPRLGDYAGAYLFGRYTPIVRIDMTHHCISAIAEMQRK